MGDGWNEHRNLVLHRLDSIEESIKTLASAVAASQTAQQQNSATEERRLRLWVMIIAAAASIVGGGVSAAGRVLMADDAPVMQMQPLPTIYPTPTAIPHQPKFFEQLEKDIKP